MSMEIQTTTHQAKQRIEREKTLMDLAARINQAGQHYEASHRAFCVLLAEAQERVPRETNMTFRQWCDKYIRRSDGSKWPPRTLKNYALLGRDDGYAERQALLKKRTAAERAEARRLVNPGTLSDEVNLLETAWERASATARAMFMSNHNLRFIG
jgi:hypothetical protein